MLKVATVAVIALFWSGVALAFDCPADTAYDLERDTTSASYGDTVATGLCACLDFGAGLTGTDSTVTLSVQLLDNEPLRAFQFEIFDNTDNGLAVSSVQAGERIRGWSVRAVETSRGSTLLLGFSL
ncbi:MAG: hypothetical protein ACE5GH_07355, partial [Fidelibacterota bacterium]